MTSAAKNKGNSWERQLCVQLQEIFGGNFQRVPNSGAFTGGKNTFRKVSMDQNQQRLFRGDIIPAEHMPKLNIECKFYSDFSFISLLREDSKQLDKWIEQTIEGANDDDVWFVCIKLNNRGAFIVFDDVNVDKFVLGNHFRYKNYILSDLKTFLISNKDAILDLTKG